MKGFIACTLAFAPIFSKSNLDRDIHFSFTFDEETACQGAPILIEELKKRDIKDGICIVGEPTNMKIIDLTKDVMSTLLILKVWLDIVQHPIKV